FFGTILALICGLIGGFIVPRYFDSLIIAASAFGGAVLAMAGANLILPGVGLFDRAAGGVVPALITLALAIAGVMRSSRQTARMHCHRLADIISPDC
ncbi:MAG: hypothetical protein ABUL48_06755, partial [Pseudorhodoplanes sp.]